MEESPIEPKTTEYIFKLEHFNYSTGGLPYRDVELFFTGSEVWIVSKTPKTIKEFEKIFNDYMEQEKKLEENTIFLQKKCMELNKEEEYD